MWQRTVLRLVGILAGLAIAGGAIAAVFLVDWRRKPEPPATLVRPVRTTTVGAPDAFVRRSPARVRAASEVTLSFQVPGIVQELNAVRGASVAAGDLLAQLDQRDFVSRLTSARVQYEQLRSELAAITEAFESNAATALELARFRSSTDRARTEVELAEQALANTSLVAPFDGVVADVFIDRFQKVGVGVPVLRLQGRDAVRVQVNVDPERVAVNPQLADSSSFAVRFDFARDREFEARLVEFTSEADSRTQTFLAIFEIDPVPDLVVLAGMPATLIERRSLRGDRRVCVPLEAISTGSDGATFVWVVEPGAESLATVRRQPVTLGAPLDDAVEVTAGLDPGEEIVTAGVSLLRNGQQVRPLPREDVGRRALRTRDG